MKDVIRWKAEIEFEGTADEFNKMVAQLDKVPVEISIPEWIPRPHHFAGCTPLPIDMLIDKEQLGNLTEGLQRHKIKFIRDIDGGMRMAHIHIGDEIVLLDRTRFKTFVATVAYELGARRAESVDDYIDVMDPVGRLDPAFQPG